MASLGAGKGSGYTADKWQIAQGAAGLATPQDATSGSFGASAVPEPAMGAALGGGEMAPAQGLGGPAGDPLDVAPPSAPSLQGMYGGGDNAPIAGQVTAPGSMRHGIGQRMPPSLMGLLKPKVY